MADDRLIGPELDDAELDVLVASLDPLRGVADGALTEREEALLRRLADDERPTDERKSVPPHRARRFGRQGLQAPRVDASRRPGRRRMLSVTLAAAVVVVTGVVGMSLWQPHDAVATAPHPLGVTQIDKSLDQVLDAAIDRLTRGDGTSEVVRESVSISWKLELLDEQGWPVQPMVHPEVIRFRWGQDGSGTRRVTGAAPYPSDGMETTAADRVVPQADTVLADESYAPGTLRTPFTDLPLGDSRGDMRAILRVSEEPRAWQVFFGVTGAQRALTLSDAQQAQILEILRDAPGLQVLGSATDRLGRPVVILEAGVPTGVSDVRDVLHLSLETGRIVGAESLLSAPIGNVPAGALVLYTAWDVSGFLPQ